MNMKSLAITCIAVFAFIFVYNFGFHAVLLDDMYRDTASQWRSEADQQSLFIWLVLGQALLAIMLCLVFLGGYENRGVMEGVRFGVKIGLLLAAPNIISYFAMPIPASLAVIWFIGNVIMGIGAGVVAALIYKPAEA